MDTIDYRLLLINNILNGKITISKLKQLKYPLEVSNNNLSKMPLLKGIPITDLFKVLSKDSRILPLIESKGTFGLPFLACEQQCFSDQNNNYFSIKIIYFDKTKSEFTPENIDINKVKKYINKYLLLPLNEQDKFLVKKKITQLNTPVTENELMLYLQLDSNLSSNVEVKICFLLQKLVIDRKTPHINMPIICFRSYLSQLFDHIPKVNRVNYYNSRYYDIANIMLSEWCQYGNLRSFINSFIDKFQKDSLWWKVLFFQILYTLSTIHFYYPGFKHNDLHLKNFLVSKIEKTGGNFLYRIKFDGNKRYTNFKIPNIGFQVRLWDFDWSSIKNQFYNSKLKEYSNISNQFNDMFNIFYRIYCTYNNDSFIKKKIIYNFFNLILHNFPNFKYLEDNNLFCNNIKKTARWSVTNLKEYTVPIEILKLSCKNDGTIFNDFKISESELKKESFIEIYTSN